MRPKKIAYLMLLILLLPAFAKASPDEAGGTVVKVVDGKTFDVRIEKNDSRIREGVERVTLADLDIPDEATGELIDETMNEPIGSPNESTYGSTNESTYGSTNESTYGLANEPIEGSTNGSASESKNRSPSDDTSAKELAVAILLNKTVWLDIDDRSIDGRNSEGELVSILYLSGLDGQPVISPSFNRMLVDYRIAELNDSDENEFDPADWWPPQENRSEENVSGEGEEAGTNTGGLNIDINPPKPNVNVNISPPNVNINPTKPKVNVNLSAPNINVNPTKPKINVNPAKPVIDVHPTQPNATENETSENLSSNESSTDAVILPLANSSEPVILRNLTAPITLINPRGSITVINSTNEVTVIDPAQPVKVINSTDLDGARKINETKPDANRDLQRAELSEAEAAPEPVELKDPRKL
jgi:hypothetical protein